MNNGYALDRRHVLKASVAATALMTTPTLISSAAAQASGPKDAALNAYLDQLFTKDIARSPETSTWLGIEGGDLSRWDDTGDTTADAAVADAKESLARLERDFTADGLSEQARISRALWQYRADEVIADRRWRHHDYELEHFNGRHSGMPSLLINTQPLSTPQQLEFWIARVRAVPETVDGLIKATEMRSAKGIAPPPFSLEKAASATRGSLKGRPFEAGATADSALLADVVAAIDGFAVPAAEKAAMKARATAALTESYQPAYGKLAGYIEGLAKRTRPEDGVWKLPDGDGYYRHCLKRHTTLDLEPEAIHAQGLREVARIHGEMGGIIQKLGFKGGLQDFFKYLREDDRFYHPDTAAGHAAYLAEAQKVVADVGKVLDGQFGIKPKAPIVVQRFEPFREGSEAIARYNSPAADGSRPGIYYVNFSNMREMPIFQLEVLAFHEAIPGHHMQIAIAQEATGIPRFRRHIFHTAYVEGWALYSERLPKELGFYKDPYSDFGRLTFELWRAIRLVVDTGIHAKRWTRAQAVDYFAGNSAVPRESAEREVDRYIVWPGQACAYYIGMVKILELRAAAQATLGARFDIRGFHDAILKNGSVPLPILEQVVAGWVQSRRA